MEGFTQQNAKIWTYNWLTVPLVSHSAWSACLKCSLACEDQECFELPRSDMQQCLIWKGSLWFSFYYITFTIPKSAFHNAQMWIDWTVPGLKQNISPEFRRSKIGIQTNHPGGFEFWAMWNWVFTSKDISCHWPLPYPRQSCRKLGMLSCATHRFSCTIGSHQNVRRLFSNCLPCVFLELTMSYFMCSFTTQK